MLVIKCAKFKKLDKSKNIDKVIENRKNVNKILDLLKNNNFVNNLYGIRFYRITIDSSSFTVTTDRTIATKSSNSNVIKGNQI